MSVPRGTGETPTVVRTENPRPRSPYTDPSLHNAPGAASRRRTRDNDLFNVEINPSPYRDEQQHKVLYKVNTTE